MVQNDEDQNDILKSTTETGKRVEKTIKPESHEEELKSAVSRKLISGATLKEVAEQVKEFSLNAIKNPHIKEVYKLQAYNLALAVLAAAQIIPGVEEIEDIPKVLSIVIDVANKGKEKGFFKELYKDVPPVLMIVPGVPEIYKSTVNQFNTYKEGFLFGKDLLSDASARFNKFIHPPAEVQTARLQFSPRRA